MKILQRVQPGSRQESADTLPCCLLLAALLPRFPLGTNQQARAGQLGVALQRALLLVLLVSPCLQLHCSETIGLFNKELLAAAHRTGQGMAVGKLPALS